MDQQYDLFLNEIEKTELQTFASNPTMLEAVRKVVLAGVYFNGTLAPGQPAQARRNFALSNPMAKGTEMTDEQLGQAVRAQAEGVRMVEVGFAEIEKLKPAKSTGKPKGNRAV